MLYLGPCSLLLRDRWIGLAVLTQNEGPDIPSKCFDLCETEFNQVKKQPIAARVYVKDEIECYRFYDEFMYV